MTAAVVRIEMDTMATLAVDRRASQDPADARHVRLLTIPVAA